MRNRGKVSCASRRIVMNDLIAGQYLIPITQLACCVFMGFNEIILDDNSSHSTLLECFEWTLSSMLLHCCGEQLHKLSQFTQTPYRKRAKVDLCPVVHRCRFLASFYFILLRLYVCIYLFFLCFILKLVLRVHYFQFWTYVSGYCFFGECCP